MLLLSDDLSHLIAVIIFILSGIGFINITLYLAYAIRKAKRSGGNQRESIGLPGQQVDFLGRG